MGVIRGILNNILIMVDDIFRIIFFQVSSSTSPAFLLFMLFIALALFAVYIVILLIRKATEYRGDFDADLERVEKIVKIVAAAVAILAALGYLTRG